MSTATLTSFGYLHRTAPRADIVVDVRDHLRDPHIDPTFRALTGHDTTVVHAVLATPGADGLINGLVTTISALLTHVRHGRAVRVAVGCAGGRHRSVVITETIASRLELAGWDTEVHHLDIHEPVVTR